MSASNNQAFAPPRIPESGFVRIQQILDVIPVGRSTWWKGVKAGRYPQPVRPSPFGPSVTVWRAEDITAFIRSVGGAQQ